MNIHFTSSILLAVMLFAGFPKASAQTDYKITAEDRENRAEFGTAVDIRGTYAVVSASRENIAAGAVYIYEQDAQGNWEFLQKLTAFDENEMAEFGSTVKFGDDFLAVAAGRADIENATRAGALYIYDLDSSGQWVLNEKLVTSDYDNESHLGAYPSTLDIHEETIAIAASDHNYEGSVYLFERNSEGDWTEIQKIEPYDHIPFGNFGIAVSLNDEYLAVGSGAADDGKGKVYVYQKNTGTGEFEFVQDFSAADAQNNSYFGTAVSMYGNQIAVGAYAEGNGNNRLEAVYIFEQNNEGEWNQIQKIEGPSFATDTFFGWICRMEEGLLMVSAPYAYSEHEGVVYVYEQNEDGSWTDSQTLETSNERENDFFGWSIGVDEGRVIVGAPRESFDENGENEIGDSGAAYIFEDFFLELNEFELEKTKVTVFPNPASDVLNISSDKAVYKSEIYDMSGKRVLTSDTNQIRISSLPSGVYLVKVELEDGSSAVIKWIKD